MIDEAITILRRSNAVVIGTYTSIAVDLRRRTGSPEAINLQFPPSYQAMVERKGLKLRGATSQRPSRRLLRAQVGNDQIDTWSLHLLSWARARPERKRVISIKERCLTAKVKWARRVGSARKAPQSLCKKIHRQELKSLTRSLKDIGLKEVTLILVSNSLKIYIDHKHITRNWDWLCGFLILD